MSKKGTVKCKKCNKSFEKDIKNINEYNKKGWNFFCCKKCRSEFMTKKIKFECKYCGNEVLRTPGEIKKSKTGHVFCSQTCSAKFNNKDKKKSEETKAKIGRSLSKDKKNYVYKKIEKKCLYCNSLLTKRSQRKYCNNSCHQKYKNERYIKRWLDGKEKGTIGKHEEGISVTIRKYLLKENNEQCQNCGWGEKNYYTNKVPLEIHHIDGNWKNNNFDNLKLLCPNCHSLTPTYEHSKGRKGKGRPHKRNYYQKTGRNRYIKNDNTCL